MFYVYCDINLKSNEIFYIGSGNINRLKYCKDRNQYWKNFVNNHGEWKRQIVYETISRNEAYDVELILIALNWDEGNLTNLVIDSRDHLERAKLGGIKSKNLNLGINGLTYDQRSFNSKKWLTSLNERQLEKHLKTCTENLKNVNKSEVICEHCKFMTSIGNYNRWHGNKCKLISSRSTLGCEYCGLRIESSNINQHSRSCFKNPNRDPYKHEEFTCNFCNKTMGINNKTQHIRSCLSNSNRVLKANSLFICSNCGKTIKYKDKEKHNIKCRTLGRRR